MLASDSFNATAAGREPELVTVPHVDLARYLGRWYEIARYPNLFEEQCDRDACADYALRDDGRIDVLNSCVRKDGSHSEAKGWAKISNPSTNAKLRVTFYWPFFGDYWVLELGENYEYAVVGEPSRKYLWILSRTPQMSEDQYHVITGDLAAKGYDAARLVRVKQTVR
jgi:apolipoprotein D and lipocalin family protein